MTNERYEKVDPFIDKAYEEIANIKASQTTLNLFYDATTQSIKKIFIKNWKVMSAVSFLLIILLLTYRIKISKLLIRRKINKLILRKSILKKLIIDIQKQYFTDGSISEGMYTIKTKKFAELIRDVDRQIPLLQEEMTKLEWRKK